ncbi:hypothetical protein AAFO90_06355, partial [Phaeobacter sp. CAU 1743]|uniref:hypothetical protein n=1 Tax=Phaeobacter sp. CAU 1743 TaxID=3140367 RepID=UPI00325AD76A
SKAPRAPTEKGENDRKNRLITETEKWGILLRHFWGFLKRHLQLSLPASRAGFSRKTSFRVGLDPMVPRDLAGQGRDG